MSFQALLRLVLPRQDHFYDFLERQAEVAQRAAQALGGFRRKDAASEIRETVQRLEHEGDQATHAMLDALAATFVTPIDREDLQRLSKRLDDITDDLNLAARACVLFGVEQPTPPMLALIDKLGESTAMIVRLMPMLRSRSYSALIDESKKVSSVEKDGDAVFRNALSALFHDPSVDAKTILREKEVLEDLEKALNHCEQVADLLTGIAVKHS